METLSLTVVRVWVHFCAQIARFRIGIAREAGMARYMIDLSPKVLADLDTFAESQNISRTEAVRRAFALLAIASAERASGALASERGRNDPAPSPSALPGGATS